MVSDGRTRKKEPFQSHPRVTEKTFSISVGSMVRPESMGWIQQEVALFLLRSPLPGPAAPTILSRELRRSSVPAVGYMVGKIMPLTKMSTS